MKQSNISEVLGLLLFKHKLHTTELARRIHMSQATLHRIVSGDSPNPHRASLERIARYFDISTDQLVGKRPIPGLAIASSIPNHQPVPIISWTQACDWLTSTANQPGRADNMVYCDAKVGQHAFALRVQDASMEPLFPIHSLLIINPEETYQDRQYVVIKPHNHHRAIFRQLILDGAKYYLKALSPELGTTQLTKLTDQDIIIGRLIQARFDF